LYYLFVLGKKTMELLQRIQRWYTINCNGDWEHDYGISITNVDNPGWNVTIILEGTCLKADPVPYVFNQRSITDWFGFSIQENKFEGVGGPENLTEILTYFLDIYLPEHIDPECTLTLHLPVQGYENKLWLKAEAAMLSESTVEIVSIADHGKATSYQWCTHEGLFLLNDIEAQFSELRVEFTVGEKVDPYIVSDEETFLAAHGKQASAPPPSLGYAE
jgi:hypothetical protein